ARAEARGGRAARVVAGEKQVGVAGGAGRVSRRSGDDDVVACRGDPHVGAGEFVRARQRDGEDPAGGEGRVEESGGGEDADVGGGVVDVAGRRDRRGQRAAAGVDRPGALGQRDAAGRGD